MAVLQSVNVGSARLLRAKAGSTGIDKMPTADRVAVRAPGPRQPGASGLAGDTVCDAKHHGGDVQAVYAYAREDLDWWQAELGRPLRSGLFGENLTTAELDVTGALIGETWRIGDRVVLQVTCPRIPCATFATWMSEAGWLRRFTGEVRPGAYLRVLSPGKIRVADPVAVEKRPGHCVTIGMAFRALTLEPDLLPGLLEAREHLDEELLERATSRRPFALSDGLDA